jgi:ribulose-phosphate 3-epimerase
VRRPEIVASVLGADYMRLGAELTELEEAGVDGVQWDIMDGRFVPNLTFGVDVVAAGRDRVDLLFEAHLMIEEPERYVADYVRAGCGTVIVHTEATTHLHRTLAMVAEAGGKPGVALNPATPLEAVRDVLGDVDLLLIMTVNPGFGGQSFIAAMLPKIARARTMLEQAGSSARLEVDGGIKAHNIAAAYEAGADTFISGSGILGHPESKVAAVKELREALVVAEQRS